MSDGVRHFQTLYDRVVLPPEVFRQKNRVFELPETSSVSGLDNFSKAKAKSVKNKYLDISGLEPFICLRVRPKLDKIMAESFEVSYSNGPALPYYGD